jgi:hypothetical protein
MEQKKFNLIPMIFVVILITFVIIVGMGTTIIIYIKQYQMKGIQDEEKQINSLVDYHLNFEDIDDSEKKKVIRQNHSIIFISIFIEFLF